MLTVMVDKQKFRILDHLKWSNLVFPQYISHTLSCLFENFFIHTTLRIFRMRKSVRATHNFSHKIKLTSLTVSKCEKYFW